MLTAASRHIEACCSLVQDDGGGYVRQLVLQTLSKRGEIVMMPKMARICGNFTKRPPGYTANAQPIDSMDFNHVHCPTIMSP